MQICILPSVALKDIGRRVACGVLFRDALEPGRLQCCVENRIPRLPLCSPLLGALLLESARYCTLRTQPSELAAYRVREPRLRMRVRVRI